jgi:glycosyltransferase involved in cell wall biosynthesis
MRKYQFNIVLDNIIFSLQKAGGISSIWVELVKRVYVNSEFKSLFIEYPNAFENPYRKKIQINSENIINKSWDAKIAAHFSLRHKTADNKPFIFHSSYYRTCKNKNAMNITTVHDFIYEYTRKGIPKILHHHRKKDAILASEAIICISENTKKDILKFFPQTDEKKLHVIHNGISNEFYKLEDILIKNELENRYGNYILFVGARHVPHKNFPPLVVALEKHKNLNLLLAGGNVLANSEIEYMDKYIKGRYFQILGTSNKELNDLYNNAFALVYPSLYEGFGLPIIEAQAAGCPVIATNVSSVTEIAYGSALLTDSGNAEEIDAELNKLYDTEIRKKIIDKGINNSKQFSFENMTTKILSLYKSLI